MNNTTLGGGSWTCEKCGKTIQGTSIYHDCLQFPYIQKPQFVSILDDLQPVEPLDNYDGLFKLEVSHEHHSIYERNYIVDESNIESTKVDFRTEDVQIGDEVKAFDWGGWNALAGRAGEQLLRDGKVINGRYTRFS